MCVIPKLFPNAEFLQCMKLTRNKLMETLRWKNEGCSSYQARKVAGVSVRRVNQVWVEYRRIGEVPVIGKGNGRPAVPVEDWEIQMVKEAYELYRVSADTLERLIERDHGKHIGHNRIHKILLNLGYAKTKCKKDKRKKDWIRYQRRHSLTAVHIDWSYYFGTWVFGVEDDASRKILALIECDNATTDKSIEGMEEALNQGQIRQCISDNGTQFIKIISEDCRFKTYLKSKGIQQILCRFRHPQSNGKIEKWFDTYKRYREAFKTIQEFLHWYNEIRPHRALNFEVLETPDQAFIRKMRPEA